MSSSRDADTYETQNDQRLDALHSKIRTLRGVTTDIYDDAERQNTTLTDTGNTFSSFAGSLAQSSRRAAHAFGVSDSPLRGYRLLLVVAGSVVGIWMAWRVAGWFFFFSPNKGVVES